jgi:formate/nitrite transporter
MSTEPIRIDALMPAEMAQKAEAIGVRKVALAVETMFTLAVLAGAFIALAAIFATTTLAGLGGNAQNNVPGIPYGIQRLLAGVTFSMGLILVIIGGAELFTGNNLIIMAWARGKVSTAALLRNWVIVFVGNFVGSIATAALMFLTKQYTFGGGAVGTTALNIANSKVNLDFAQAIALGIMCNALVCLAVWMTYSARSTIDKIAAIVFPISAFVAAGFEHNVANMYFIPVALFIRQFDPAFYDAWAANVTANTANLTWGGFLINNLLPVTIGNIIGGAVLVGVVYWFVYLRKSE